MLRNCNRASILKDTAADWILRSRVLYNILNTRNFRILVAPLYVTYVLVDDSIDKGITTCGTAAAEVHHHDSCASRVEFHIIGYLRVKFLGDVLHTSKKSRGKGDMIARPRIRRLRVVGLVDIRLERYWYILELAPVLAERAFTQLAENRWPSYSPAVMPADKDLWRVSIQSGHRCAGNPCHYTGFSGVLWLLWPDSGYSPLKPRHIKYWLSTHC